MKIGFLGGTFNPPHLSHKETAYSAMEKLGLDKIVFIPSANPPHKNNLTIDAHDRFKMTELMIEDEPCFEISDLEFKRQGKSFTKDTLSELKTIYPEDEIFWIIGMDSFVSIPSWENADGILEMANFVVTTRKGYDCEHMSDEMKSKVFFVDKKGDVDTSSTELRDKIKNNEDVSMYFDENVLDFIKKRKLYL